MKDKGKDKNIIKRNEEESNRVVADMNIEGMPWHVKSKPLYQESQSPVPGLDKKELRRFALSATLGGLLIGAVFMIIIFLFIMFCIYIWF